MCGVIARGMMHFTVGNAMSGRNRSVVAIIVHIVARGRTNQGERMDYKGNEIKMMGIKKLTLMEGNPRKITGEQFDKLVLSLKEDPDFFFRRPVLVNKKSGKHLVYAGNQRVLAAKKAGWQEVPAIIDEDLSEAVMRERMLKDNVHHGHWDYDMLANEFEPEDLLMMGFTPDQLSGIPLQLESVEIEEEKEVKKEGRQKVCPHCGKDI